LPASLAIKHSTTGPCYFQALHLGAIGMTVVDDGGVKLALKMDLRLRLLFLFVVTALCFLVLNEIYVEVFSRRVVTLRVTSKNELLPCRSKVVQKLQQSHGAYSSCSSLFTSLGTFRLPQKSYSRFLDRSYQLEFWNDRAEDIWSALKAGCSYKVVVTGGSILAYQALGENRMPALNTIVNVLERVEKTEHECDISAVSGKPVCEESQVTINENGISPTSSSCDFETFAENYMRKKRPKLNWYDSD
jgi:hypothetical protein